MDHLPLPNSGQDNKFRVFGVGDAGIRVLNLLIADGLSPECCVALNAGEPALHTSSAHVKLSLETQRLSGLGSGGDPERARQAAEERTEQLKSFCGDARVIFLVAGLGGGSGTGIAPVLARIAKQSGALVLAFVTMPFGCEGTRRQALAEDGIDELNATVDGVICLPNQKLLKLIQPDTTVLDTFKISNRLLADGVQGVWRLVVFKGLIEIPLPELFALLQEQHAENAFAVAQAAGPGRSDQVLQALFANPLLEQGAVLAEADAVVVSLTAGPDLTMAEVDRVMQEIKAKCQSAQVMMGACMDERFGTRLAVTVVTGRKQRHEALQRGPTEELDTQLLDRKTTIKPGSRFVPPPPSLPPEQVQKLLSRQGRSRASQKSASKLRQTQLPLEIVSRGRFDKSEPTIHKGEDLDVPTYIRRGVSLN